MSKKTTSKKKKNQSARTGSARKVAAKIRKQIQASRRLAAVEQAHASIRDLKQEEARFNLHMLLSVNALIKSLVDKGVVTIDELTAARVEVTKEFQENERRADLVEKGDLCTCRCEGDETCQCPCHQGEPCDNPRCKFCEPFREEVVNEQLDQQKEGIDSVREEVQSSSDPDK